MSAADQNRLRADARTAYSQQFVPSWKRLESFLRDTYLKQARPEIGLSTIPDGTRAYASLIRAYTTTRLPAAEIHQLGLKEVTRIEGEMARVAREAGFTGTVAEFERRLAADPAMHFASQEEMLQYARNVLARVEPQLPRLFKKTPRMTVGVRPIAPDREAATASNYTAGTADGTRPAWFNMNTYRPTEQTKYTIDSLVLHETVPGHHLQVGLARELEGIPGVQEDVSGGVVQRRLGALRRVAGHGPWSVSRSRDAFRAACERAVSCRPPRCRHRNPLDGVVARSRARILCGARALRSRWPKSIATSRVQARRWRTSSVSSRLNV